MSIQREVFEGQTTARRAKRGGLWKGGPGVSPGNFQKPVLEMVQSELYLSMQLYIYIYFSDMDTKFIQLHNANEIN